MAEVIFQNLIDRDKVKTVQVASAGIEAESGKPMMEYSKLALQHCGEKFPKKEHKSTLLTKSMLKKYDHIVCITRVHKWQIDMHDVMKNVYVLSETDVADPYGGSIHRYIEVCNHLQKSVGELYNKLCKM